MVNLTTHELRLIARKRGIKNYQNMPREKLLSTLNESEHIFKDLSQNELEQIAEMRHSKNYKNMSREELLIGLLKSKQRHAELYKSKSNNAEIKRLKNFLIK